MDEDKRLYCISQMCDFPSIYKTGDRSPMDIMRETGYPKLYSILTSTEIIDFLKSRPELIETWVKFSEDIRYNPAWGFYQDNLGRWTVAYSDSKSSIEKAFVYADRFSACTKMIVETFESIRRNDN